MHIHVHGESGEAKFRSFRPDPLYLLQVKKVKIAQIPRNSQNPFILCLSSKTVDTFPQSILKKLGLNTAAELAKTP